VLDSVCTAFVPGVAIYRALETGSCLDDMTLLDCHSEPTCWRHDLDRYRYLTHGVTAAFQAVAAALFTAALCLSSDNETRDPGDVDSPDSVVHTGSRRVVHLGNGATERRTHDVRQTRAISDVTNIAAASQPFERYNSVYETRL